MLVGLVAVLGALLLLTAPAISQEVAPPQEEVRTGLRQLRHVVGSWDVATTFLRDDGSEAGTVEGTYTFDWVPPDAVVAGSSTIPVFNQTSAILFYLREATGEIEMSSVGPDGQLWVMTGPIDGEVRETPVVAMPDGSTLKLRFTRYNVEPDRFESRMDRSTDGGESWVQGNHQVFVRRVR